MIAAGAVSEALVAAVGISASFYVGALIGAAIYASAKQGWDFLSSGIDMQEMYDLYRPQVPVINLPPPTEELSTSYQQTAQDDAPPPPPFPGQDLYENCADAASVWLVTTT